MSVVRRFDSFYPLATGDFDRCHHVVPVADPRQYLRASESGKAKVGTKAGQMVGSTDYGLLPHIRNTA